MDQKKTNKRYLKYLGYGVGAIGMDLSYGLFNSFLTNYFTDLLLIAPLFLSVLTFSARIWDGINDPMMGTIVDNTHTKFGKFRPWILIGSILNAIVLIFLFTNPGFAVTDGHVNIGLYIYIAVMYVLWGMTYTIVDIPYWSMVPALTSDLEERNIVATIPRLFSGLGQAIIVVMTVKMVSLLGKGNESLGYSRWAMVAGLILILGCVVTFVTTKEKKTEAPKSGEKFTLGKAFKTVKQNDQLLIFILTAICYNTGWYLVNGLGIYYFKAVLGKKDLFSLFGAICAVGQFLGLLLLPVLSKKWGKKKVIQGAMLLTIVGYLAMFLFGPALNIFAGFVVFAVLGSMGVGCMFVAETVMLADIVDYSEYKLGYRTDSIVFSMKSLLLKVAYSIQGLIIGVGLQISHYDGNLAKAGLVQGASAKTGICVMMFLIPPVFAAIAYVVFSKKYKLHGEFLDRVIHSIQEKHEQQDDSAAQA